MSNRKRANKSSVKKSRKQLRKEQRKNKKIKRNEFYINRRKPGQYVLRPNHDDIEQENHGNMVTNVKQNNDRKLQIQISSEEIRDREKRKQIKLQKEMAKQRRRQMMEANLEEDRTIKRLAKHLKLDKRKSKLVPASFMMDGLDYLLEVCDSENLKSSALAEQQLSEVNDEFQEDLVLMTNSNNKHVDNSMSDALEEDIVSDCFSTESDNEELSDVDHKIKNGRPKNDIKRRKQIEDSITERALASELDNDSEKSVDSHSNDNNENTECDGTWEDIYGRIRAKDGSVVKICNQKYIPPPARLKVDDSSADEVRYKKLDRLKKQLKGLLNRLAESNMHNITTQMEELYMNHSRNDMNNTLTTLITEALVSHIMAPERLLMEHVLLVTILHANVGTEVGAHFLQTVVNQFEESLKIKSIENKTLDNIVIILAQLYNFKLFDSKLIYEVVSKLSESFEEKDVECILHILRNVGFNLRKDNPIALKNLILNLQRQAAGIPDVVKNNSRIKFMLDILLAIKNNNVSKIPNYDTSYSEHLKKIMKSFIRTGNYATQLNISLEDLLNVQEKGKWWMVGSAWKGNTPENNHDRSKEAVDSFSQKLLQLAIKQRMNTDTRRNIFCIIMSAEDYLDAFEKLTRLGLRGQQERDIIHVIVHCCLHEKTYNPFYAALAQKFCDFDRKYQMTIKFSIWDKLKALKDHSAGQISHLAKLLSFLFVEKGLPISTLKVVQFSELDKTTLRFIRQILLGILLHADLEVCKGVFDKVSHSDKLKMFKERLRLFMHHFLLRNLESQEISDDKKELLQARVKIVEKMLVTKEFRTRHEVAI